MTQEDVVYRWEPFLFVKVARIYASDQKRSNLDELVPKEEEEEDIEDKEGREREAERVARGVRSTLM